MAHSGLRSVWAAALGAMVGAAGTSAALAPATDASFASDDAVSPIDAGGSDPLTRLLDIAAEQAVREGEAPATRRTRLLERIANGHNCFVNNPTPAQLANIAARYGGRNPAERVPGAVNRFLLDDSAWDGSGLSVTNQIGRGQRINLLTYSFPADGTMWFGDVPNDLNAKLQGRFGQAGADNGRELFRQTLAGWKLYCGVDYLEVCDDNTPLTFTPPPSFFAHGDIRFGANPLGADAGVLALNFFPESGGDMVLNSDYFDPIDQNAPNYYELGGSGNYRRLRNAIAHEHGHGLGFRHVIPCFEQKLMEPFASTVYDTMTVDERRGAQHNYGDRFAGNHTPDTARELGLHQPIRAPLGTMPPVPGLPPSSPRYASTGTNYPQAFPLDRTDPTIGLLAHSVVERDLSTNGRICGTIGEPAQLATVDPCVPDADPTMVSNPTGQDWFKFTIENEQEITITVDPTGAAYENGRQTQMCTGPYQRIFPDRAGNLNLELWTRDLNGVLTRVPGTESVGNTTGAGINEVIAFGGTNGIPGTLLPGTYFVRVYDAGPNIISIPSGDADPVTGVIPQQAMPTQLYDLFVRLGPRAPGPTAQQLKYAPLAIAGVDKIARIGEVTAFIGDIYSRTQEPNTPVLTQRQDNFEWDLDGDGDFEINIDDFTMPPLGQPPISPRAPFIVYGPPNRIVPVTLRVLTGDSAQPPDPRTIFTSDTDTIFVKVVGEPIVITSVTPATGVAGSIIPITITGTGLGAVTDARQIVLGTLQVTPPAFIPDSAVIIVGQPRSNAAGTQLDNIAVAISTTAAPGLRVLQITDGCAVGQLPMAFEVTQPIPPPPQDECAMSGDWGNDLGVKNFDSQGATLGTGQTFPGTPCAGQIIEGDVWYRWTVPACTSATILAMPMAGVGFDVRMAVYSGNCPPTGTLITCGSGAAFPLRIPVTPNQVLYFRVGGSGPGQTGTGTVTLAFDPADPTGACCRPGLACFCTSESQCDSPGDDFTAAGVCNPEPCPGRCCFLDGTCQANVLQAACAASPGGAWEVAGTTCAPNPCPQAGACCSGTSCVFVISSFCANRFLGVGTTCLPDNDCIGACCATNGACTLAPDAASCPADAAFLGGGTTCTPSMCDQPVACCDGQSCTFIVARACSFTARPSGTVCAPANECAGACCDPAGACTVIDSAASCPAGSTYLGNGSTCTPNACPQPVACCSGTTCRFIVASACTNVGEAPLASGTTCAPTNNCGGACCTDTGLCSVTSQAACSSNFLGSGTTCTPNICPQPVACCTGTTCRFVVAGACTNAGETPQAAGSTCAPANDCGGACCGIDGACTLTTQVGCTGTNTFAGAGTVCNPAGACAPAGACCDGTTCLTRTAASCATIAGAQFLGASVTCAAATCAPSACCNAGACSLALASECSRTGGTPLAGVTTCTPDPCVLAVCCEGRCFLSTAGECAAVAGNFYPSLLTCAPETCLTGACCTTATGVCVSAQGAECLGAGEVFSAGMACSPTLCSSPLMGACCSGSICTVMSPTACTGMFTRYAGDGLSCNPLNNFTTPCCKADFTQDSLVDVGDIFAFLPELLAIGPRADFDQNGVTDQLADLFPFLQAWFAGCGGTPTGACCDPAQVCTILSSTDCAAAGGTYEGDGVTCTPINPCATPVMGACCTGSTCSAQTQVACTGANTTFAGANTVCNVLGNPNTPCCKADFNHVGGVTVQDIFDFVAAYINGDIAADTNGDGTLAVQDIFDFLAAYINNAC